VNYFQSIGKAKISMFLSILRQVVLLIPLVLILPHFFQLNGIWIAGPVSDLLSSLVAYAFILYEMKNLKQFGENS